ncbi:MAG: hypothetical protein KC486_21530 [Myxococcales bacterium]|nr:hypothetical protein [Myxococcales bacterium]
MAHDGDHRRPRLAVSLAEVVEVLVLLEGDVLDGVAELAGHDLSRLGVDRRVDRQAAQAHPPEDAEGGARLLAHLVREIGDLDDLVDADALLGLAHLLSRDPRPRRTIAAAAAHRHLAPATLRLRALLTLLALGGATAPALLARVGDDHLLRATTLELDEADDLGL